MDHFIPHALIGEMYGKKWIPHKILEKEIGETNTDENEEGEREIRSNEEIKGKKRKKKEKRKIYVCVYGN